MLDCLEARALEYALGPDAARKTPVGSIKGAIGSPFGAAGAMQVVAAALSLMEKRTPPTRNFETPDPDCNLRVSGVSENVPRLAEVLVNGHAFGGVNSAGILRDLAR